MVSITLLIYVGRAHISIPKRFLHLGFLVLSLTVVPHHFLVSYFFRLRRVYHLGGHRVRYLWTRVLTHRLSIHIQPGIGLRHLEATVQRLFVMSDAADIR